MAAVAILRQQVDRARSDHSLGIGQLPARLLLGTALEENRLAAEPAVDLDPILPGAVAGFAGDARDRLLPVVLLLHREMAVPAQAVRPDAPHTHLVGDLVRLGVARHVTVRLEVMRGLPRLGLLLVAFGTGVRADGLGDIDRNCTVGHKGEDQHAEA